MVEKVFRSVKRLCHAGLGSVRLRREVAERLAPVVPFDAYGFGTTDPDTGVLSHLVADGLPPLMARDYIHRLYPQEAALHPMDANRAGEVVYSTAEESREVEAVIHANGFHHGSHVVFGTRRHLWGKWCMLAQNPSPRALATGHALLRRLAPHLTHALRQAALIEAAAAAKVHDTAAAGVVVLDRRGRASLRTPSCQAMLDDLADVGLALPDAMPLAVLNAVRHLRARARAADVADASSLSLRAQGRSGRWYALQACLSEPDVHGNEAVVVVLRPVIAREVATMLTIVYGLSPREREVAAAVARGLSTKEIAAELVVSVHTVKEHLDRACEKTGARGRKALVARLFLDAYVPHLFDARPSLDA